MVADAAEAEAEAYGAGLQTVTEGGEKAGPAMALSAGPQSSPGKEAQAL